MKSLSYSAILRTVEMPYLITSTKVIFHYLRFYLYFCLKSRDESGLGFSLRVGLEILLDFHVSLGCFDPT